MQPTPQGLEELLLPFLQEAVVEPDPDNVSLEDFGQRKPDVVGKSRVRHWGCPAKRVEVVPQEMAWENRIDGFAYLRWKKNDPRQ